MKRLLIPLLAALALPTSVLAEQEKLNANSNVKKALNEADSHFQMACEDVAVAMSYSNSPYYMTSTSLKSLVKEYADRCDLKF